MTAQKTEALRLADKYEVEGFLQDHRFAQNHWCMQAAVELRRLHAENEALRSGYDASRLEIESLRARVQGLGQMLRENRSKRIVELEAQLEAIGAGGVETLRRRECLHQISEPAPAAHGDAEDAAPSQKEGL